MAIRIQLVEDQAILREGLRALIQQQSDMEVVGEADNGQRAVELARQLRPDVIVMDVAMPGTNGIEATQQIKEELPEIRVLALSAYNNAEYVMGMIRAGVCGYLLKDCAFEELVSVIRTVVAGKSYLSPDVARVVLALESAEPPLVRSIKKGGTLADRDRELIKRLAEGLSAREIAERDQQSVKTIEGRRRRIMKKLGLNNAAELVRYAVREGLVSADPVESKTL
ncbi:MAG: response regulator transcription factor [Phycisphaerales bacterium]|nr:MAG: response regulator transcription factor [Phycisphaerales bacterium]